MRKRLHNGWKYFNFEFLGILSINIKLLREPYKFKNFSFSAI